MKYKLLIAEDETVIRRGLVCAVDWRSLECDEIWEASDGEEALEIIRVRRPDIVIMDINLPIMDGLEVLEQTQSVPYTAIILSGYANIDFARRAMKTGAIRYLLKPVNFDELKEAVESAKAFRHQQVIYDEFQKTGDQIVNLKLLSELPEEEKISFTIEKIIDCVENRFAEKITLHQLAEELHYSETFLIRKFKEEIHIGFNEYLTRYRLQKSISLLRGGVTDIEDIANRCGFQSGKYFKKVFASYVGCTPREFLRLL